MQIDKKENTFGHKDSSYKAAGEREGILKLVTRFYEHMQTLEEGKDIFAMHSDPTPMAIEKLTVFLSAWLGGPREYEKRFGPIRIPRAHAHLAIDEKERDAWLLCMQKSVDEQEWRADFKAYFMKAIFVPAERVRVVSKARRDNEA